MSKTRRDKKRYQNKQVEHPSHSYKLHFGMYYDSHPCTYKKLLKRKRRTESKQALREGKEPPIFKNSDNCNYHNDW